MSLKPLVRALVVPVLGLSLKGLSLPEPESVDRYVAVPHNLIRLFPEPQTDMGYHHIRISPADARQIGRGREWGPADVFDLDRKLWLRVVPASCGAACYCAARVTRASINPPKGRKP